MGTDRPTDQLARPNWANTTRAKTESFGEKQRILEKQFRARGEEKYWRKWEKLKQPGYRSAGEDQSHGYYGNCFF